MSSGGLPAGQLPPGQDWITREFRKLHRQIRELRAEQRLAAAQVVDSAGQDVFKVTANPPAIFLRQELVSQLTLAILGQALRFVDATDFAGYDQDAWVVVEDLSTDPVEVEDVEISSTGRCLVLQSGSLVAQCAQGETGHLEVSYGISGATTRSPGGPKLAVGRGSASASEAAPQWPSATLTRASIKTGLNPGLHTFTTYARWSNDSVGQGHLSNSNMIVVPF